MTGAAARAEASGVVDPEHDEREVPRDLARGSMPAHVEHDLVEDVRRKAATSRRSGQRLRSGRRATGAAPSRRTRPTRGEAEHPDVEPPPVAHDERERREARDGQHEVPLTFTAYARRRRTRKRPLPQRARRHAARNANIESVKKNATGWSFRLFWECPMNCGHEEQRELGREAGREAVGRAPSRKTAPRRSVDDAR